MFTIVIPILLYNSDGKETNNYTIFKGIGLPSYVKFLNQKDIEIIFICPRRETDELIRNIGISFTNFKVFPEEELLTCKSEFSGWTNQQLIKLAVSKIVTTDLYLVLDSDHYLTQPFGYKDLFSESNRIKYHFEPWQTENGPKYSTNSQWWEQSAKILDFPMEKLKEERELMSVTPQILVKSIVQSLLYELGTNWQNDLGTKGFTEFTLYWLYVLIHNYKNLYAPRTDLWQHNPLTNVLTPGCDHKTVTFSFLHPTSFFSVIQGYINQDLQPFIQEAKNFLEEKEKPYDAIFLIASMVTPSPGRQQAYHPRERLQQTTDTCNSVKKYCPNSLTVLIEGSQLDDLSRYELHRHFDFVLECGENPSVNSYTHDPRNCGHGEMKLLEIGAEFVKTKLATKAIRPAKRLFKLGARYLLNDKFNINYFDETKYTFRPHYDESVQQQVVTTGLFSIPIERIDHFITILKTGQLVLTNLTPMVERMYLELLEEKERTFIDTLGLEGNLSYHKKFFSV